MRGNLAWAAVPAIDNVDVWDRFNGVPTLGIMTVGDRSTLFWRSNGYVDDYSAWVYILLSSSEAQKLRGDDVEPLPGLLFGSPIERPAWVAAALDNRLIFEREWVVPAATSSDQVRLDIARFLNEAIELALEHEVPPTRRELMERAARATRTASDHLAAAQR
jgi:hypothetical protein